MAILNHLRKRALLAIIGKDYVLSVNCATLFSDSMLKFFNKYFGIKMWEEKDTCRIFPYGTCPIITV